MVAGAALSRSRSAGNLLRRSGGDQIAQGEVLIRQGASIFAAALCAAVLIISAAPALLAEINFPQLTGRVIDKARLLSPPDEKELREKSRALEDQSSDQLVVVTLPSLQGYEIEEFGYRLGRHWGIGQAGKDNGVLLIVAPNERKVRIEVGRGLEPLLTDALSKVIIENGILPLFRSGDFAGGIKAGVADIIAVLSGDSEELMARARQQQQDDDFIDLIIITIWIIIFVFVVWRIVRSARRGASSSSAGKGKSSRGWDWGSGGSSGGGWSSGGGGFSGGGGGFGGGGSSGSW